MRFVLCNLLVLAATRRLKASGRRVAVSEVMAQPQVVANSDAHHSETSQTYSVLARARHAAKVGQKDLVAHAMGHKTLGLNASGMIRMASPNLSTAASSNHSSSQNGPELLRTPASASQFVQLGSSTNKSSNHSSTYLISNVVSALMVRGWDGTLNFKGVMLLLVFFCLGCVANACMQTTAGRELGDEYDDEEDVAPRTASASSSASFYKAPRSFQSSPDSTPTGSLYGSERREGSFVGSHGSRIGGKVQSVLTKGKERRGAESDDHYKFGDFTRGIREKMSRR